MRSRSLALCLLLPLVVAACDGDSTRPPSVADVTSDTSLDIAPDAVDVALADLVTPVDRNAVDAATDVTQATDVNDASDATAASDVTDVGDVSGASDVADARDASDVSDVAVSVGPYPSGPYGIREGDVLANLSWEGYQNLNGTAISTTLSYGPMSMQTIRETGRHYALVHLSEFY